MRFTLLIGILLSRVLLCNSQKVNYVKDYHPFINEAENLIIGNLLLEALYSYENAFKRVEFSFAKDEYNALLCCIMTGRRTQADIYLKNLALKGIDICFLEKNKLIKSFTEETHYKYQKYYPTSRKYNYVLIETLNKISKIDQDIRTPNALLKEPIAKTDSSNAKVLLDMIYDYGFPSEQLIGYDGVLPKESMYNLIIIHQNRLSGTFNFSDILFQAVENGSLLPNTALMLMLFQNEADILGFSYTIDTKEYIHTMECQHIDKERLLWGISTIKTYSMKVESPNPANFEFNIKKMVVKR